MLRGPHGKGNMDVLQNLKGLSTGPIGYFFKNGAKLLQGVLALVLCATITQLVFLGYAGEVKCSGFDEAQTQRCTEARRLVSSGCGTAHSVANNADDPHYNVGRGTFAKNNQGTTAVIQFLSKALWYLVDERESLRPRDCSTFLSKPIVLADSAAFIVASSLPCFIITGCLCVYAGQNAVFRSITRIRQITSPDSNAYDDFLEEAYAEVLGSGRVRHLLLALIYQTAPLIIIAGMVLNQVVFDKASENNSFLSLIPRTVEFWGIFTGTPLLPLNGWYKEGYFSHTDYGRPFSYGPEVKKDPLMSWDAVYQPPSFGSGLVGTNSTWDYFRAMTSLPNMPTPVNVLFPSQVTCLLNNYGSGGTIEGSTALCTVKGNAGIKIFLPWHHFIYLTCMTLCGVSFFWRSKNLVSRPSRRSSLRQLVPTVALQSADMLTNHLYFPQWLVLHNYLS